MKPSKPLKPSKNAHTADTKYGMGDYYGTGVRQKIGRMREGMGMQEITPKKMRTPPKSLA